MIKGRNKAGGAILAFDPDNAEATLKPYAWGFRNVVGIAWNKQGEMFACQNGYDINGPRPILDQYDPTYRVREDAWYGCPDFSAAFEPVTDPKLQPPGQLMYPVFENRLHQSVRRQSHAVHPQCQAWPASAQGAPGMGIERPFDVKFGPDGAMYIVDFGQMAINVARIAEKHLPFEWPPKTGMVWKVTKL